MEHGNWATHIGRQPGGRRIEAQQYRVGRPWSGWVGTNVVPVQLGVPMLHDRAIAKIDFSGGFRPRRIMYSIAGRGEPGASVLVHIPGFIAQWVGVDGNGEWNLPVNREFELYQFDIEIYQTKSGYQDSRKAIYGPDYRPNFYTYTVLKRIQ